MMKQDLNDMAAFAKIISYGSFTKAAEELSLPKSNLSRRIARLEDRLGVRLMERTTRRLNLTEIGQIYYNYCSRIVEEANQADLCVENMLETPRGELRISASVTTSQYLLSPFMSAFMAQYPEIKLQLICTNRQVDLIEEGLDVALRIGELQDSTLVQKKIGVSQLKLFASQQYLEEMGYPGSHADLKNHRLLIMLLSKESSTRWNLFKGDQQISVQIEPMAKVNDFTCLYNMIVDSGGIAAIPDYIVQLQQNSDDLVQILPAYSFAPVNFHALYPSHRSATPKLKAFLDFISEKFKGM